MSGSHIIQIKRFTTKSSKPDLIYGTATTKFGNCLVAFHDDFLCYLNFFDADPPLDDLNKIWGNANLREDSVFVSNKADELFGRKKLTLSLLLKGTDFQMKVWESLLRLKEGMTCSYEDVARDIGKESAVRAVAGAVAKNNINYFIPCHRVIRKNGSVHKYRSGAHRKVMMLQDEGAIH